MALMVENLSPSNFSQSNSKTEGCVLLHFYQMCGGPGISAFPEGDNILCWKGTISGSKETVYEGMEYKLSLTFHNDYPFKPPKVKFDTPCFHPNVDIHGNICLDILQVNHIETFLCES